MGDRCRFEVADVRAFRPDPAATVLTNPPLTASAWGDAAEAARWPPRWARSGAFRRGPGLYAITADADFEQHFGQKAARRRKIYNGMIPCQLYMYYEQKKPQKKEV